MAANQRRDGRKSDQLERSPVRRRLRRKPTNPRDGKRKRGSGAVQSRRPPQHAEEDAAFVLIETNQLGDFTVHELGVCRCTKDCFESPERLVYPQCPNHASSMAWFSPSTSDAIIPPIRGTT